MTMAREMRGGMSGLLLAAGAQPRRDFVGVGGMTWSWSFPFFVARFSFSDLPDFCDSFCRGDLSAMGSFSGFWCSGCRALVVAVTADSRRHRTPGIGVDERLG